MQRKYTRIDRQCNNLFQHLLPNYVRSANDKDYKHARIRRKDNALSCDHICPNPLNSTNIITLDFDKPFYAHDNSRIIPPPNLVVYNKHDDKSHAHWFLESSVHANENSSAKAKAFLNDVTNGLTRQLGADPCYNHSFTKNPLVDIYRTHAIHTRLWSLDHLADYIKVSKAKVITPANAVAQGRNCYIFETVRKWSYTAIRTYMNLSFDAFYKAVEFECKLLNKGFAYKLYPAELKDITKSIARWVWDRRFELTNFSKQVARANKLALKRKKIMQAKQERAIELKGMGLTISDIAREMETTRKSVYEWLDKSVIISSLEPVSG